MRKTVISFFLFIALTGFSTQDASEAEEYSLKAAFIYNFTRYIEWDTNLPEKEFIIGVIGDSRISEPLEELAKTKTVNGKKIIIRNYNDIEEMNNCSILFISKNAQNSLGEILDKAKAKNVLTISEEAGSCYKGAGINFVLTNETLKFEINKKTIDVLGLKASSQLLKLALNVY